MGKAERTRQFIIEQAAPIFNKKGIAGATIDEILSAAKVAKGCLYHHFENRDELAYETTDYLLAKISTMTSAVLNREVKAKDKLFAYLDANSKPLDTFITGGCPIFNMAVEADDNNPVIKEKVKTILIRGQKMFAELIRNGIKQGEFTEKMNPEEFAFRMFSAIEGATVICRVLDSNAPIQGLITSFKAELESYTVK